MGPLGIPEIIIISILALLIFGPRKLPELGRTLGKALAEFRRASTDLRSAIDDEVREMERQTREVESEAREALRPLEEAVTAGSGPIAPSEPSPAAEGPRDPDNPPDDDARPA